jgi:SAM-dependent methyltransferase
MRESMASESAAAHIARLRSSREAYDEAADLESRTWGDSFSNAEKNAAREEDRAASASLGVAKDRMSLVRMARKQKWQFNRGLSLACGSGRAERQLVKMGVCSSFVGIDIAPSALEEARRHAEDAGYAIVYRAADLNHVELPSNEFDLVVTQSCLHHVLELEYLAEQIWRSLTPTGLLWVDDFIGETQFQWTDRRLAFVNGVLNSLPEEYRYNRINRRLLPQFLRKDPGTLVSPFEAIRSGDIMPVFLQFFDVVEKYEHNSILHLVCPPGTRGAYAKDEAGKQMFEMLRAFDRLLIETETLPPLGGQYLLRRKGAPSEMSRL